MDSPEIEFKIEINGRNVTNNLTPYLMSLTYEDNLTGKADELHVELDNTDFRFFNEWFFSPGLKAKAWIGQMYCGEFMIDNPAEHGPPHIAGFKAQSAEFAGPLRMKKSFTHHAKSLKDIVQKYANDHNLKVIGSIPDLNLKTIVQMRESDIDFLHNLAKTYGCICSVKGGNLVFDALENIWKQKVVKTIVFSDVISYHFDTSLPETLDAAVSVYDDPYEGDTKGAVVESSDVSINPAYLSQYNYLVNSKYKDNINGIDFTKLDVTLNVPANTVGVVHKKVESTEEGKRVAMGELLEKKNKKHHCTLTLPGNELFVAGASVHITEFGKRSGYWLIEKSSHKISKAGAFTTTIEIIHGAGTTGATAPEDKTVNPDLNLGGGGGFRTKVGNNIN